MRDHSPFELLHSPPQPAGLRTCAGAAFASFEKYAAHFSNPDFVGTEPNEAPYAGTGVKAKHIAAPYYCTIASRTNEVSGTKSTSICRALFMRCR